MDIDFSLNNLSFCIELLTSFPFASDSKTETMLDWFLFENYPMPSQEWYTELYGQTDKYGNELEPWNGTVLQANVNQMVNLFVEFHPQETVYFFNDIFLGNTGGHFRLSLLKWEEFLQIVQHKEKSDMLFFLLLPLVVGLKSQKEIIDTTIDEYLTVLPFKKEHFPIIRNYLVNHLIFEKDENEMFIEDIQLGTICKRNHSERNISNSEKDIIQVNQVIELALKR